MISFSFSDGEPGITHVGIYIGGTQFIHAATTVKGVIISDLDSEYYTSVWYGAARIVA